MRTSLLRRLEKLEQQVASLEKPEPAIVLFDVSDEEAAAAKAANPKRLVVRIIEVCGRGCTDDCPDRGNRACQYTLGAANAGGGMV